MTQVHAIEAARLATAGALTDAAIEISEFGTPVAVTVLDHPPSSGLLEDGSIPGLYVYVRSERVEFFDMERDRRVYVIDVMAQVADSHDAYMASMDDLHLQAETAILGHAALRALAFDVRPTGADTRTERGEVMFAARRISFEVEIFTPRNDPRITYP